MIHVQVAATRERHMWKFLRAFTPTNARRRECGKAAPGPLANLAYDYAALDALAWPVVRRRLHPADSEAR
jgi:hypothetical protein